MFRRLLAVTVLLVVALGMLPVASANSQTRLRFDGTGVALTLESAGPTTIRWRVDGGDWQETTWNVRGGVRLPLVGGLTDGEHTVIIEPVQGQARLLTTTAERIPGPPAVQVSQRFEQTQVTWAPPAGAAAEEQQYEVLRWVGDATEPEVVATTTGVAFTDADIPVGSSVRYAVRAVLPTPAGQPVRRTGMAPPAGVVVRDDWTRVEAVRGTVEVERDGQRIVLAVGDAVLPGDRVLAGSDGWVELNRAGHGHIRLDADTTLRLVDAGAAGEPPGLALEQGTAWVDRVDAGGSAAALTIATPQHRAAVAPGGIGAVAVAFDGSARVWSVAGTVSVDPTAASTNWNAPVTLEPGGQVQTGSHARLGQRTQVYVRRPEHWPAFVQEEAVQRVAALPAALGERLYFEVPEAVFNRALSAAADLSAERGAAAEEIAAWADQARAFRTAAVAAEAERQRLARLDREAAAPAESPPAPPWTTRVSVASDGTQAGAGSFGASISADGRYVAFASSASNLVAGDTNGKTDVFVHDRQTGTTERVSVATGGTQAEGFSNNPSISADGRYVAFASDAWNDDGTWHIFVHDRVERTTERVSVGPGGVQANGFSDSPSISADGRYVAFESDASNLVAGGANGARHIFVRDRQDNTTQLVSVDSNGNEAENGSESSDPSISGDGRYVAFASDASNLVAGDNIGSVDIFVHDREAPRTTVRVSVNSDGIAANSGSSDPSISANGRYVAFVSNASNLVDGDDNDSEDVFVHDREADADGETERVSVTHDGIDHDIECSDPSISADGRYVAFASDAPNLVADDDNGKWDIFVRDRQTGETVRVSVGPDGAQANSNSEDPSISADGRYVAFRSAANLVGDASNGQQHIYAVPVE